MSEIPEPINSVPEPALASKKASHDLTLIFALIAAGLFIGVIIKTKRPVYTVNDGSRWNTVFYLVEHGTYEFKPDHGAPWGKRQVTRTREIPPFITVDMIKIGEKDVDDVEILLRSERRKLRDKDVSGGGKNVFFLSGTGKKVLFD